MNIPKAEELFDLSHTIAKDIFSSCPRIYDAVGKIRGYCEAITDKLGKEYEEIYENVYAPSDAIISDNATLIGPAVIGHGAEIRQGAFIRGGVIIGDGATVGNSTEIKNSIIFDGVQLPHYNYVGDSIVGYRAHLGAGAVISNLRLDKKEVTVRCASEKLCTGLRKFGALVGDFVEVGCNSVICPGSILSRGSTVYPLSCINGLYPETISYERIEKKQL